MHDVFLPIRKGIGRLSAHVTNLSPGDRLITAIFACMAFISSLAGLYALERAFLIEVPARGGSVTEGVLGSPRFVNPLLALSDADRDLTVLTYAGLMGIDESGEPKPVLAESYDVDEEGKVYTFRLREDARFSDGSPVTAEDVVFTVKKAQDPALKSPELPNWANIAVEIVDARTIRFTLPKAYAPFLESTTLGILPAHLWRDVGNEEFPFSPLMENPVGAGPFRVADVKRDTAGLVSEYTLAASETFVLGRPYLDTITLRSFSREEDLRAALSRGTIDSAHGIPVGDAMRAPYAQVFGVFLNADQNPLFARKEVRQALSIAANREKIVETVLGGFGTPIEGPVPSGSGIALPERTVDPLPQGEAANEARMQEAAEVLEEEGWTYDEEEARWHHEKEGLTLSLALKTSNVPVLKSVAGSLREDWQKLGVPVSIELYEPGDLTQNVIRPRQYEALLFGMVVGREHDLYAFWSSSERSDPGLNISLYANRTVDELLESMRSTLDRDEARESLKEVNDIISADYPAIFTHTPDFVYAAPHGVKGIMLPQIESPSDRFVSAATWYRNTEFVWPIFTRE